MLLVTGTSGAGKTFTIEAAMRLDPSLVRLSGSGILREIGRPITALTKRSALENQLAIADHLAGSSTKNRDDLMFDGHAVLETIDGLLPVPFDAVGKMGITGIALIDADTADVAIRRANKKVASAAPVRDLQAFEEAHSREMAGRLKIPHVMIRSGDAQALLGFLRSLKKPAA